MSNSNAHDSICRDLEHHPELTPLLDLTLDGRVECFGWVSPVYEFSKEDLEEAFSDD